MTDELMIAEKLSHAIDLLRFELQALRTQLEYANQLTANRLDNLETSRRDHEARLRQVQDAAIQFKLLAGLATGGGLLSVIALLKALITP
jgi:DNA repair exonuclease SbcCD ATPase subunit